MFIPLHDANSLKRIRLQYVTVGLIVVNAIIFVSIALEPGRPGGHFWLAANMGVLAEQFGLRQGLKYRGTFDGTPDVVKFADALETVCVQTVEAGKMTKDLAVLISPTQPWLTTEQFLDALDAGLKQKMQS